ncbi:D-alanyl-D-alanine carboxypeptidase family protein [Pseudogemmobacter sp. W21_MBD1_M6]|uniref:D-alanyl-D-alanine carboxypeptidase family protein n=1 Tax=Pseudogemmobacter sp. W21_MBD1_M6 TaxID=3240271 RepID=UPI003F9E8373
MLKRTLTLITLTLAVLASGPATALDTKATAAYVIDHTTGTVLMSTNADVPLPPASMSKLMTVYMVFEALRDGRLTLDETLPVSAHAMSYAGSTMFLNTTDRVRVEDLIRGIIVLSGNDACAVVAEALSPDGTEAGFSRMMTERGKEIGLTQSNFTNSNGWPQAGHRMSVKDLATLAERLITDFPEYYPVFGEKEFVFDNRAPDNRHNRNPLLKLDIGADGLKTGHTSEAGYGLVGSAKQGNRRVVFVLSGMASEQERSEEAEKVVNWAFRQFVEKTVAKQGAILADAPVWMGSEQRINLVAPKDLSLLVSSVGTSEVSGQIVYRGPLEAPIAQGQEVAELVITREGLPEARLPLIADRAVAKGGFVPRIRTAAQILMGRIAKEAQGFF